MQNENESTPDSTLVLGGLNERSAYARLATGEVSDMHGVFPGKFGLLERIPGKVLLKKFPDGIRGIHQTFDSHNHIIIQTASSVSILTLDELLGRVTTTNLIPVDGSIADPGTPEDPADAPHSWEEEQMSLGYIVHVEANNVSGGASSSTYTRRKLTNIVQNETGFITSLDTTVNVGQFVLAAGNYRFEIQVASSNTSTVYSQARLFNVTDNAPAWTGLANEAGISIRPSPFNNCWITLFGSLSLSVPTTFEIQQKTAITYSSGMGHPTNAGEKELYAIVKILKTVADAERLESLAILNPTTGLYTTITPTGPDGTTTLDIGQIGAV